jgi:sec-independent protein translocase protein TatA
MGNIGVTELLVIALIAVLLFGAGRIADIGKGLGQGIKNFKQGLKESGDDKEEEEEAVEKKAVKKLTAGSKDKVDDKAVAKKKVRVSDESDDDADETDEEAAEARPAREDKKAKEA